MLMPRGVGGIPPQIARHPYSKEALRSDPRIDLPKRNSKGQAPKTSPVPVHGIEPAEEEQLQAASIPNTCVQQEEHHTVSPKQLIERSREPMMFCFPTNKP